MSAVLNVPMGASRGSVIPCTRCGASRPAGHVHCYVCGGKLGVRSGWLSVPERVVGWSGWAHVRGVLGWVFRLTFRRRPAAAKPLAPPVHLYPIGGPLAPPRVQLRTWGDRVARWYTRASLVAVAAWLVAGSMGALPASAGVTVAAPTEACAWIDTQRMHVAAEVGRLTETHRSGIAQRIAELAALVGSGQTPG